PFCYRPFIITVKLPNTLKFKENINNHPTIVTSFYKEWFKYIDNKIVSYGIEDDTKNCDCESEYGLTEYGTYYQSYYHCEYFSPPLDLNAIYSMCGDFDGCRAMVSLYYKDATNPGGLWSIYGLVLNPQTREYTARAINYAWSGTDNNFTNQQVIKTDWTTSIQDGPCMIKEEEALNPDADWLCFNDYEDGFFLLDSYPYDRDHFRAVISDF
ncbi:MAG: hypothetical protein ACP5JU_00960, partial [Minisyncoccia bacterium]